MLGDRGELLGKEKSKEEIVSLGVEYSLASKHTSFICVEKREAPVINTMESRSVNAASSTSNKVKTMRKIVTLQRSYGGGGGGATATRSKTAIGDISRGLAKKQKVGDLFADTPFGIKAEAAPKNLSDPFLQYVFMVELKKAEVNSLRDLETLLMEKTVGLTQYFPLP